MKFLRAVAWMLIGLFLSLSAAGWGVLGTRSGINWLLQKADDILPGSLLVSTVQGNLLGELKLQDLVYIDDYREVRLATLYLKWSPGELLHGRVRLNVLEASELAFLQKQPVPPAPDDEPFSLPDVSLPVDVHIERLAVEQARLITAADATPVLIDSLNLAADWVDDQLQIQTLKVGAPQGRVSVQGNVRPSASYPVDLSIAWALTMAEQLALQGQGKLKGDLNTLRIDQQIGGDVQASLGAEINKLLEQLNWKAHLRIQHFPALGISEQDTQGLTGLLKAQGDLQRATANIELARVAMPEEQPLGIKLNIDYELKDQQFDLRGDWQQMNWPLSGEPMVVATEGLMTLKGRPTAYELTLMTALQGSDIPSGHWLLKAQGDQQQLRLNMLEGDVLDGRVVLDGKLAWTPQLQWDLNLTTQAINPGKLAADWPGRIDLKAHTQGSLKHGKLLANLNIKSLSGQINDKPIEGKGRLGIGPASYSIESLELSSGRARLRADGKLADRWDLKWSLHVPDLSDLLPQGQGSIEGQGKLGGNLQKPVVEGRLTLAKLNYQHIHAESGRLSFDLGLDPEFKSKFELQISQLLVSGQQIEQVQFKGWGSLHQQRLNLDLSHAQGRLSLALQGGYLLDKSVWQGQLDQLKLAGGELLGNWQLEKATPLTVSAQRQILDALCLADDQTRLCANVDREGDQGKANFELKNLALERFRHWLPPELSELRGQVNAEVKLSLAQPLKANLQVRLESGQATYLVEGQQPISLPIRLAVLGKMDDMLVEAEWKAQLGEHRLSGKIDLPRLAFDKDMQSASLTGQLNIALNDLDLLTVFVPDIEKITGQVNANLKLGGRLGNPLISGQALMQAEQILIPRLGLELKDTEFKLVGDGSKMVHIEGQSASGEGDMHLHGQVMLDAQQGWPARLTLKGENFQLANLPEAQVLVTPDLQLAISKELIKLRGKLFVPKALVSINDLPPGSQSISPDVVVLNEDGEIEQSSGPQIDAKVVVELGDEVNFNGFGLHVALGGKLTVDQGDGRMPRANGELMILSGSFRAYGQDLTIEKGRIYYAGGRIDNPGLRLRASRKIDDITVGVNLVGTAKKPDVSTFSSDPEMTSKDTVSMLLTGQKTDNLSEATIYAGRQITPRFSVGVNVGAGDAGTEFVARYKLLDNVDLEATSSSKKSGASIGYTFEIE